MHQDFGNYFREKRIEKKLTLRSFCEKYGFDTAYISRLENNKLKPPSREKLEALANALGLQKNSKDWVTFFSLAYESRKELPTEIRENAPEVISLLPAFLRSPTGKKISKEKLDQLIRFLRDGDKENQ